jgi:hypothetical protein
MKFPNIFSIFNLFVTYNKKLYYSTKIHRSYVIEYDKPSYVIYDDVYDIYDNIKPLNTQSDLMLCSNDEDCNNPYKCCNHKNISNAPKFCCIKSQLMLCEDDRDCQPPYKCCSNYMISNITNFCCIDNNLIIT